MRIPDTCIKFLLITVLCGLLSACNVINNKQIPGVTYITNLGNPAADALVWSPVDSIKVLVSANDLMRHNAQVYVLDIGTKKRANLVDTDYGEVWGSAWSPDGEYVALSVYGVTKGFSKSGLWVINMDNNSMVNITDRAGDAVWLPDGNTLALLTLDLASDQNPRQISIYLIDVQTKESELIYSNKEALAYSIISSSPDGQHLVFTLMFDYYKASDLFVLDVRNRTVEQLTQDGISDSPQWSPYGNLIVYQKAKTIGNKTTPSLHIALPDGSCDVEIPNLSYASSPTWSPDGRKIAFIGEDGIYILDTDIVFGRDIYQNLCP